MSGESLSTEKRIRKEYLLSLAESYLDGIQATQLSSYGKAVDNGDVYDRIIMRKYIQLACELYWQTYVPAAKHVMRKPRAHQKEIRLHRHKISAGLGMSCLLMLPLRPNRLPQLRTVAQGRIFQASRPNVYHTQVDGIQTVDLEHLIDENADFAIYVLVISLALMKFDEIAEAADFCGRVFSTEDVSHSIGDLKKCLQLFIMPKVLDIQFEKIQSKGFRITMDWRESLMLMPMYIWAFEALILKAMG